MVRHVTTQKFIYLVYVIKFKSVDLIQRNFSASISSALLVVCRNFDNFCVLGSIRLTSLTKVVVIPHSKTPHSCFCGFRLRCLLHYFFDRFSNRAWQSFVGSKEFFWSTLDFRGYLWRFVLFCFFFQYLLFLFRRPFWWVVGAVTIRLRI